MIKRRFYKHEHGDRDGPSDGGSSSSDSELEAEEAREDTEEEEEDAVAEVRESNEPGYESEDSSANAVDLDSSGLPTTDDDMKAGTGGQHISGNLSRDKGSAEMLDTQPNTEAEKDMVPSDVKGCVLKCKSVFKCRLCPRLVCLTEETMKAHLESKRHGRSVKLLSEGRLKLMLNSDGEIDGETHQERHASTLALAQNSVNSRKRNKGRQRQKKRQKKKTGDDLGSENSRPSGKNPAKKRRKK
ncbi:hypothetical protein RJ640_010985 [Escallonia rubra]|uniref:Uncharacterized protein n=1 Tax=Escallonia rubra TaxID=112253 RepID=A0AA88UJ01_9ASTE|nr:hypothetical protein RJ640_010985 [Escallonia rubra]